MKRLFNLFAFTSAMVLLMLMLCASQPIAAQNNVGINPTGALPDPSAALDIVAADKGLLIPRMTAVQRLAIPAPSNGLLVFDTDSMCVLVYRAPTATWFSLCSGGSGGNGHNSMTLTTAEPAGANCPYGGTKLEFGIDLNDNGVLDVGEILGALTRFVCNGAPGVAGATGPQGPAGAAGATGATGPQGPAGPTGPQGPAGTGFNTVALTTVEPAGINCPNGGVLLQFGLDANSNGVLDAGEINPVLSRYVCNGAQGPAGAAGATGPQGPAGPTGATGATGPAGPTGATGPAGPTGATGATGAQGPAGPVGCLNANYVLKNDGVQAVCSQIYDNGTNVGVGTAAPTQKIDVAGAVKFSGALMPNNNAGTTGQILQSQGAGAPPIWQNPTNILVYGNNAHSVKLNALVTNTNTSSWSDITGMSITFTPVHSTFYVFASMCSRLANTSGMAQFGQALLQARVLANGVEVAKAATVVTDFDEDSWGGQYLVTSGTVAFSGVQVACTPGVPITVKLQWCPVISWATSPWRLEINPTSSGVADHCVLTVFD